jgi:hypothetical protein
MTTDGKTTTPEKSAGPYTPAVTPERLDDESTGQWNFRHGSATPPPKK